MYHLNIGMIDVNIVVKKIFPSTNTMDEKWKYLPYLSWKKTTVGCKTRLTYTKVTI